MQTSLQMALIFLFSISELFARLFVGFCFALALELTIGSKVILKHGCRAGDSSQKMKSDRNAVSQHFEMRSGMTDVPSFMDEF